MKKQQLLLIGAGAVLVAALFFLGETTILAEKRPSELHTTGEAAHDHGDLGAIIEEKEAALSEEDLKAINKIKQSEMPEEATLKALALQWDSLRQPAASAYYYSRLAGTTASQDYLQTAADRYFVAFRIAKDPEKKYQYADQAVHKYEELVKKDSSNIDNQLKLALSHIEGTEQAMNGVVLLLNVVKKDPENVQANLLLGKLAVFSGQYDKAIERLKKLTTFAPTNAEAYYFLGEAYKGKGERQKAIKNYTKSKDLIKNPAFDKEIENKIKELN